MPALSTVWRNVRGFVRNAYGYVAAAAIADVLPTSITSTINWLLGLVPRALGLRETTPREQINANIVLAVFWFLAGFISLGATWVIILAIHLPLALLGVARWFPGVNETWQTVRRRLPVRDDYDLPGWRSE